MFTMYEGFDHEEGDKKCKSCWDTYWENGLPSCADSDCSGLIHNEFGDENWDGDYWLYYRCDKCADTSAP